jgi:hypothetical protein
LIIVDFEDVNLVLGGCEFLLNEEPSQSEHGPENKDDAGHESRNDSADEDRFNTVFILGGL